MPELYAGHGFDVLLRMAMRASGAAMAAVVLADQRGAWIQDSIGLPDNQDADWSFVFHVFDRETLAPDASEEMLPGAVLARLGQFCVAAPFDNPAGTMRGMLIVADHNPLAATPKILGALEDAAGIASGMLELVESLHEQRAVTNRDTLTGFGNRAMFDQTLQTVMARTDNECAAMFVHFDRVRQVTDLYGQAAGNELLLQMTRRLRRWVGDGATIFRLADDRFGLIVEGEQASTLADLVAQRIIEQACDAYEICNTSINLPVSIGAAVCPDDTADWRTLMRCAEAALSRSQRSGERRNLRRYETHLDASYVQHTDLDLDLDPDLRQALAHDELRVHWQKRVNAKSGVTEKREALLRWVRPGQGLVLPDAFVPAAESSGTVALLDRFALREACRQAASWPEGIGIAVNVSPRWFRRGNLVRTVCDALADSGLDPIRLQLEVTEKVLMTDADQVLQTMERLKALGVSLGLDDFGTAYSSLAYLARFPFDTIKLDRSFVASICEDPRSLAIGRAIIQVGRSLEMTICAEGVETSHQRDLLLAEGVDEFQGYFFGRPDAVPD